MSYYSKSFNCDAGQQRLKITAKKDGSIEFFDIGHGNSQKINNPGIINLRTPKETEDMISALKSARRYMHDAAR